MMRLKSGDHAIVDEVIMRDSRYAVTCRRQAWFTEVLCGANVALSQHLAALELAEFPLSLKFYDPKAYSDIRHANLMWVLVRS